MYSLGQELCQGNLAVLGARAAVSTEDSKHVTVLAQGHMVLMCFYQPQQAQAAAGCVPGSLECLVGTCCCACFASALVFWQSSWQETPPECPNNVSPLPLSRCGRASDGLGEKIHPLSRQKFPPKLQPLGLTLTLSVQSKHCLCLESPSFN